ncbi:hypothetical protein IJG14_08830 [bacterium]|nr:hypothetical protein [bacterium]
MKKFLFLIVFLNLVFNQIAIADDFHEYYKSKPAYDIKSFNYENLNRIPIKIKIVSDVTTKKNLVEGQKLIFLTTEDAVLNYKKILPAGSRIIGTVETISQNEIKGIPANLIIGDFKIEYMAQAKLEGQINKQGANRTIWVRALIPVLFPIKGGHAKIKSFETYEIYYTPNSL